MAKFDLTNQERIIVISFLFEADGFLDHVYGFHDAVTSVALVEAGTLNSLQSGTGEQFQRVVYASVTLADSDFLKLQLETQVGSR